MKKRHLIFLVFLVVTSGAVVGATVLAQKTLEKIETQVQGALKSTGIEDFKIAQGLFPRPHLSGHLVAKQFKIKSLEVVTGWEVVFGLPKQVDVHIYEITSEEINFEKISGVLRFLDDRVSLNLSTGDLVSPSLRFKINADGEKVDGAVELKNHRSPLFEKAIRGLQNQIKQWLGRSPLKVQLNFSPEIQRASIVFRSENAGQTWTVGSAQVELDRGVELFGKGEVSEERDLVFRGRMKIPPGALGIPESMGAAFLQVGYQEKKSNWVVENETKKRYEAGLKNILKNAVPKEVLDIFKSLGG